jgi:hypothetical protein
VNMLDLNTSSIPVTLHLDPRFQQNITTSYSGIQIPTNVYHEGTLNEVLGMKFGFLVVLQNMNVV